MKMKLANYVNITNVLIQDIPRDRILNAKEMFEHDPNVTDSRKAFVWWVIRTCFRRTNYKFYDIVRKEVPGTNDNHWYTLFNYVLRVYCHL